MPTYRKGWERQLFKGTAGSSAATQVTQGLEDVDVDKGLDFVETTDRGDSTSIPVQTESPVKISANFSFKLAYYDGNAVTADLIAAAENAVARAMLVKRINGGLTELDGDYYLTYTSPGPLAEGMVMDFEARATKDHARDPIVVSA